MELQRKVACQYCFKNDKFVKTETQFLPKIAFLKWVTCTHLKRFVIFDNPFRPLNPLKNGKKLIIQVSFEERGTPFKRSPTPQNQDLVGPISVNRVPIALRILRLRTEICCSILPRNGARLEPHRVFNHLLRSNKSSKDTDHHRNIAVHSQCLPAPTPTRMAALRTRDLP